MSLNARKMYPSVACIQLMTVYKDCPKDNDETLSLLKDGYTLVSHINGGKNIKFTITTKNFSINAILLDNHFDIKLFRNDDQALTARLSTDMSTGDTTHCNIPTDWMPTLREILRDLVDADFCASDWGSKFMSDIISNSLVVFTNKLYPEIVHIIRE